MKKNALLQARRASVSPVNKAFIEKSFQIADRIASILQQRGMTQKQLAEIMGKRECEVSKWMRGTHNFTIDTIAKIEQALDSNLIEVASATGIIISPKQYERSRIVVQNSDSYYTSTFNVWMDEKRRFYN